MPRNLFLRLLLTLVPLLVLGVTSPVAAQWTDQSDDLPGISSGKAILIGAAVVVTAVVVYKLVRSNKTKDEGDGVGDPGFAASHDLSTMGGPDARVWPRAPVPAVTLTPGLASTCTQVTGGAPGHVGTSAAGCTSSVPSVRVAWPTRVALDAGPR